MVILHANPNLDRKYFLAREEIMIKPIYGSRREFHSLHIAAQKSGCEVLERSAVKIARSVLIRDMGVLLHPCSTWVIKKEPAFP